ncbi:MAG TPA: PIN domain-containing protein [Rubrivivax sp.]|nr:PIN domain-containing protein [Rubrivivax sp.]
MPNGSTVFVDTNVLLYAVDPRDPHKQQAAQRWIERCWQRDCGRLSTQVLNEMYVNLLRLAPALGAEPARRMVREYRAWRPWIVDDDTVDLAWALQDGLSIHYWDALMVAAAQQQGCTLLLTEDLQHGQLIDGLRIVNPCLAGPDILDATA